MTSLVCTVLLVAALQTQENTLIASAEFGNTAQVVRALGDGSPIDARYDRGRTALIVASAAGHLDVVRVLITKGAELNAQADNGWKCIGVRRGGSPEVALGAGPESRRAGRSTWTHNGFVRFPPRTLAEPT